jgi:hypothetical protein
VPDDEEGEAVERDAVLAAALDLKGEREFAIAVGGPGGEIGADAGAELIAVAGLEILPLDRPCVCHVFLPEAWFVLANSMAEAPAPAIDRVGVRGRRRD